MARILTTSGAPSRVDRTSARWLVAAAMLMLIAAACVTVDTGGSGVTSDADDGDAAASAAPTGQSGAVPGSSEAPSTPPPRSDELTIGYIALDESLPFSRAVSSGVRAAADAAETRLTECDPRWSRTGVLDCAATLAEAGVHGVISFQPFGDLAAEVCATLGDAPTVGIVFDQGPCQVSQLVIDQAESGRIAGHAVGTFAARRWDCDINAWISLESGDADPDGRARMQGYRDGFREHCPMPDATFTLDGADRVVTARKQVGELLADLKGSPNIVVGLNEDAILGAMAAVAAADRERQVWYSGQLADPSIRRHIACDDRYIASVAQFPERFGPAAVSVLLDALDGQAVDRQLRAEMELVTSANVRSLFPSTDPCDA